MYSSKAPASLLDLQTLAGFQRKSAKSNSIRTNTYAPNRSESSVSDQSLMMSAISFKTLEACKLGISRFPDFEYDARGGNGTGALTAGDNSGEQVSVKFDIQTLYIPPLTSRTTKFLGLPLPPFLRIDISPELFAGTINQRSGQVDLEFEAKFLFSVGSLYRASPLVVKTTLTSEESFGKMRSGKGRRLSREEGKCTLVGVAVVDPIDDFFLNSFLALPTECLARLHAVISFSHTSTPLELSSSSP